jgi:hypothetical protein
LSLIQSFPELGLILPGLADQRLAGYGLMGPLDDGMVGGTALLNATCDTEDSMKEGGMRIHTSGNRTVA